MEQVFSIYLWHQRNEYSTKSLTQCTLKRKAHLNIPFRCRHLNVIEDGKWKKKKRKKEEYKNKINDIQRGRGIENLIEISAQAFRFLTLFCAYIVCVRHCITHTEIDRILYEFTHIYVLVHRILFKWRLYICIARIYLPKCAYNVLRHYILWIIM